MLVKPKDPKDFHDKPIDVQVKEAMAEKKQKAKLKSLLDDMYGVKEAAMLADSELSVTYKNVKYKKEPIPELIDPKLMDPSEPAAPMKDFPKVTLTNKQMVNFQIKTTPEYSDQDLDALKKDMASVGTTEFKKFKIDPGGSSSTTSGGFSSGGSGGGGGGLNPGGLAWSFAGPSSYEFTYTAPEYIQIMAHDEITTKSYVDAATAPYFQQDYGYKWDAVPYHQAHPPDTKVQFEVKVDHPLAKAIHKKSLATQMTVIVDGKAQNFIVTNVKVKSGGTYEVSCAPIDMPFDPKTSDQTIKGLKSG